MKFRFILTMLVIMALVTVLLSACHTTSTPKNPTDSSSTGGSSTDGSSTGGSSTSGTPTDTSENTEATDVAWDVTALPEPTAVDSFDVPVMVHIGIDTEKIPQRLYYNGEVKESGHYTYLGEWNDRYYFKGIETFGESFICSCDKNYENFEKYSDIPRASSPHPPLLYDGVLYNWTGSFYLYAYDLATKELKQLINDKELGFENGFDYAQVGISTITDGWIWCWYSIPGDWQVRGYQIETGEIIESSFSGRGADGKLYSGNKVYDPYKAELTVREDVKNPDGISPDTDGDLWVRDMHEDGKNFTLRKLCDAKTTGNVNRADADKDVIVNGWYYYRYTPDGSEETYLARLNLTTGKTEYCPNIIAVATFWVMPHYWGYTREQDTTANN